MHLHARPEPDEHPRADAARIAQLERELGIGPDAALADAERVEREIDRELRPPPPPLPPVPEYLRGSSVARDDGRRDERMPVPLDAPSVAEICRRLGRPY